MRKIWLLALLTVLSFLIVSPVSADGGINDRVVVGGSAIVDRGDIVNDLVVFGGSATVLGKVTGDVVVFGGSASISGDVAGTVVVFGGSADLKSTSVVGRDVAVFGGSLNREEGAIVGGSTGDERIGFSTSPLWGFVYGMIRGVLATIALLGLAVLAVAFFPRQLEVTEDVLENAFWQSAGIGTLTLFAILFLTPVLIISLIGIPVAILVWMLLFLVVLYALVVTANLIGERVLQAIHVRVAAPLVNALAGVLLLMSVAVPFNAISGGCLGTVLLLLVVTPGIGATALSRFGTLRWRPSTPGTPPSGRMFPPPASQPPPEAPGSPQA